MTFVVRLTLVVDAIFVFGKTWDVGVMCCFGFIGSENKKACRSTSIGVIGF